MSINPVAVDTAFTFDRRGIYYTTIASLCVHFIAYYLLSLSQGYSPPLSVREVHSPIRVQIAVLRKPPLNTQPAQSLEELSVLSSRKPPPSIALSPQRPKTRTAPQKLRIDNESIAAAIRGLNAAHGPLEFFSENGAIVVNADLLKTLNQSERRQGIVAGNQFRDFDSSFSGGVWSDFVQMGDRCFRVVHANPLESMSREMWYRTKCSR
ncbi:MAG: hypothetical protein DRR42_25765 [Gammaproteobacteria bacterium]|nr:MAG: hypothetical protein DRR42_25765 [Gammaproteobacteria bacterium]